MAKSYVPYLTMSKCDKGSKEKPLTINPDHGVIYHDKPLLNANDHYPEINIPSYGECAIKGKCKPNTADKAWQNVNKNILLMEHQHLCKIVFFLVKKEARYLLLCQQKT